MLLWALATPATAAWAGLGLCMYVHLGPQAAWLKSVTAGVEQNLVPLMWATRRRMPLNPIASALVSLSPVPPPPPAPMQVTTLLSKEQENRAQQSAASVSPEQLQALRQQVSDQGGRVKDAKAVSAGGFWGLAEVGDTHLYNIPSSSLRGCFKLRHCRAATLKDAAAVRWGVRWAGKQVTRLQPAKTYGSSSNSNSISGLLLDVG